MKTLYASAVAILVAAAGVGQAPIELPSWVERIGWTLVHSIWQLAAVALLAAMANYLARRSSAPVRYVSLALALATVLSLPVLTWFFVAADQSERLPTRLATAAQVAPVGEPTAATTASRSGADDLQHAVGAPWTPPPALPVKTPLQHIPEATTVDAKQSHAAAAAQDALSPAEPRIRAWRKLAGWLGAAIAPQLPWLVCAWFAGVGLGSLRPLCGIWTQWRLRRRGLSPVPNAVSETFSDLARRMRLSKAVRIAQSTLVHVPLVVGYFRPLILLPGSVVTGLTAEQLEAILAHELAHVRRHDWLINALQVLAETVLFYHPAVWWLSRRLRYERELCCDDLAIGLIDNRAVFARALLLLEELRQSAPACPLAAVTLAATGGQLSARIRRLLPVGTASDRASRGWLPGAILLLALGMAGGVSLLAAPQGNSARQQGASSDVASKKSDKLADTDAEAAASGNAAANRAKKQSADGPPANGKADAPQRVVTVVDENERPVTGAAVKFQFEVTEKNLSILSEPATTDADGQARAEIPDSADRVYISVTADGFSEGNANESARGESTIQLRRGRVIRVRAVDSDGRVLKDAVPLLAGTRTWGREFKRQANGTYQSPDVDLTRRLLRVACAQEQGPILFSDLIDVETTQPGKDGVYELNLRPGVRLEGRLDHSAPRPITEGFVELTIVEGDEGKLRGDGLHWHDFTPVRPDGTFTFESLPGGGHAQLHVLVDGYISKNPSIQELTDYVRKHELLDEEHISDVKEYVEHRAMWPRLTPLDRPQVTCTIPCEPTAACNFRLVDPSGIPVPDAEVAFNPNGVFLFGGLFIPGTEESQALLVDGLRRGLTIWPLGGGDGDESPHGQEAKRRYEWAKRSFLRAKSDVEGRVRVRNLPGGDRDSFQVTAKGLVLPVSPLLDDDDLARRNAADDQDRYGMVELVSGETIEKTIYLERVQPVVDRELIVVNREGKPLANVSLAVAELCVGEKDWQTWSTQRFGPLPRGNTDGLGRVILRLPSAVDDVAVERVRLGVNYKSDRNERANRLFVHRRMVEVPLASDDGLIVLLPDPQRPNTGTATYPGVVKYGRLEDILPNGSLADWLAAMIKQPNLAVLRKLLAGAKIKYPEPVELSDNNRRSPGDEKAAVVKVISDGTDKFAIIEARVRPLGGLLADESDLDRLPECSYVFDIEGNLLAALGGELGVTGSSSPDDVDLISLGPQEDWFVRVTRFEKHGPFEHLSTYYRLAKPIVNSLQYFHHANSNAWSNGPEKIVRFGTLYFDFPEIKEKLGFKSLGTASDGVAVIPELVWDGDRNRFVGAAAQWARKRPLYEVHAKWSKDFEALSPKADQLVIDGGERDYEHWHLWEMAVPAGCEAIVTLSIPQREGPPQIVERKLSPGRQKVQVQLKPMAQGASAKLKLWISDPAQPDEQEKLDFDLSHQLGERPAVSPPIFHTLNPAETARVLNRSLTTSPDKVTIDIKLLVPQAD